MGIGIDASTEEACTVLAVSGDLDLQTAPELEQHLADVAGDVVVDLSAVEFLDSSGIGVLVNAALRIQDAGGAMRLACPRPHVQKVFRISRLAEVMPIHDSVAEATAAG